MRKQTKIFIVLAVLAIPTIASAEQSSGSSNSNAPIALKPGDNKGHIKRPKAPDRQAITCAYDGEQLLLTFVYSEGMATLSVTDETLLSSTYEIDTAPLVVTVPVGQLNGTVSIELETESGRQYIGEL